MRTTVEPMISLSVMLAHSAAFRYPASRQAGINSAYPLAPKRREMVVRVVLGGNTDEERAQNVRSAGDRETEPAILTAATAREPVQGERITPGLRMPLGSSVAFRVRMSAISSSVRASGR